MNRQVVRESAPQNTQFLFAGFSQPEANWSKLPHAFVDALPLFSTKGEMAVVLYILRHTWGFQEFEEGKRITLDEFQHGRRRRDGTRLDNGVGLSRPSIIKGLKQAESHGFIDVAVDATDAARIRKTYRLRMTHQETRISTPKVKKVDSGVKGVNGVKKLNPGEKAPTLRTEKDTSEKKVDGTNPENNNGSPPKSNGHAPETVVVSIPEKWEKVYQKLQDVGFSEAVAKKLVEVQQRLGRDPASAEEFVNDYTTGRRTGDIKGLGWL